MQKQRHCLRSVNLQTRIPKQRIQTHNNYVLYKTTYRKFKNKQNKSTVTEISTRLLFGVSGLGQRTREAGGGNADKSV